MSILALFWNYDHRRLRLLWRLILQLLIFVACLGILAVAIGAPLGLALGVDANLKTGRMTVPDSVLADYLTTAFMVIPLLATLASLWISGRFIDRRPFAGFGFHLNRQWWADLGFGLLLGAVLMAGIFLIEYALGWVTVTGSFRSGHPGQPFILAFLVPLLTYLSVGIYEEALTRGYLLTNLAEGLNLPFIGRLPAVILAWLISSSIFGALHMGNPNSSPVSTISLIAAGLFLGLGYVLTGDLAIPIGIHITWNLFQGNVFGFPVSGTPVRGATFIAIRQGGPDLWTGGAFGPEAGLLGIAALIAGSLLILLRVRRRFGSLAFDRFLGQYQVFPRCKKP